MSQALIGHLDADSFYVSCERVRAPSLVGLPAGVLGNQGACVIARSYEMKQFGVTVGMPIWDSVKLCPQGIYIKRDFRWYEVISRQLLQMLRAVSPAVEYYSIDEMFFDAAWLPRAFNRPLPEAVAALQGQVLQQIQVPVSIGVSRSKTLAKLLSDGSKPFGWKVLLEPDEIQQFLATRPVDEISGIARRSREKLEAHGIVSCREFAAASRRFVRMLLTRRGENLWWELNGTPTGPILTQRPPHKFIGRGGSLGESTSDPDRLAAWIVRNLERLIEELDHHQVFAARLALALDFKGGGGWSQRAALPGATARLEHLLPVAQALLTMACRTGPRVSGMHLWAEKLSYRDSYQVDLFTRPDPTADRIAQVKQFVNERVGRFAVRNGMTLFLPHIYADRTNSFDICDVRGKQCF